MNTIWPIAAGYSADFALNTMPLVAEDPRLPRPTQFTAADILENPDVNCGPAAIAGLLDLDPMVVVGYAPNYFWDHDRRTTPTCMGEWLRGLNCIQRRATEHSSPDLLPKFGLVWLSFNGRWPDHKPGAERWEMLDRYARSHWIAAQRFLGETIVYDGNWPDAWMPLHVWRWRAVSELAPACRRHGKGFHFIEYFEVERTA